MSDEECRDGKCDQAACGLDHRMDRHVNPLPAYSGEEECRNERQHDKNDR